MHSDRLGSGIPTNTKRIITIFVIVMLVVLAGCNGFSEPTPTQRDTTRATDGDISTATGNSSTASGTSLKYTRVYQKTIDSVVSIRSVGQSRQGSLGSGFVYRISDETGYIVTNAHVVSGARTVGVKFQRRGAWRTGTVIGRDVYTDLAVIKVSNPPTFADALPLVTQEPDPGQKVVALGNPYGLTGTITHGIISAVNRTMPSGAGFPIPDTIQTDAPINPGNSGGPLVSLQGKVIGVNRATRKGSDNIGFAISADIVRQVVPVLINQSAYHHAYLGVRTVHVTQPIAKVSDMKKPQGVLVMAVNEGSPADGILQPATATARIYGGKVPVGGDVIVAIENVSVSSRQALLSYLMLHTRPGETISLTIIRDGTRMTVQVTLEARPPPTRAQSRFRLHHSDRPQHYEQNIAIRERDYQSEKHRNEKGYTWSNPDRFGLARTEYLQTIT
jgi:serine protease Do